MQKYEHPFSWNALGRIITAGLILLFVWKALPILILILISAMLSTALYPLAKKLDKHLPMIISAMLVVCLLLIPFIILGLTIIPSFINQLPDVLTTIDGLLNKSPIIPPAARKVDLSQYAENAASYVLLSTTFITSIFTSLLTLFFLTFYFLLDGKRLVEMFLSVLPSPRQKRIARLLHELAHVNGQYVRGGLFISTFCGLTIFIGLTLMNIPFAAPLAIFTALLDLFPLVGLTLAMIPAILIGLSISPFTALLIALLYLIYQQIEGGILAPTIYNKALHISPALGFIALIIGASLFGVIGAFLALPTAASIPSIIKFLREDGELHKNEEGEKK